MEELETKLEKHAHLFAANRKFSFIDKNDKVHELAGCYYGTHVYLKCPKDNMYYAKKSTLIARPFEDMTDDELKELHITMGSKFDRSNVLERLENRTSTDRLTARDFRYLLSIGVYPFDQSHFDNGTVIDSRKV